MLVTLALAKVDRPRKHVARQMALAVKGILQSLAHWNAWLVSAGVVGPLYDSGIEYRRENGESFVDAAHVDAQGWGDCSNLVAWRVGELLAAGEPARVHIRWRGYDDGYRLYHVLVRRGDGSIEDPSRILGMD